MGVEERLGEALIALDEENYPAALLEFFHCLNLGHEPLISRYGILWCYAGLGQLEQARAWTNQFHQERSSVARGLLQILDGRVEAGTALLLGLFADFGELPLPPPRNLCFALLAELRPEKSRPSAVWTTRALVLRWLGRLPEAFACLAEALKGSGDYLPATAQIRDHWITQRPSLPAPGETFQEVAESPPPPEVESRTATDPRPAWYDQHLEGDDAESLYQRAEIEAHQQNWHEALEWLRRVALVDPFHLPAALLRFEVLLNLGEGHQAFQEGCAAMDMLENSEQLERARSLGERLAREFPQRARSFLKNVLLYHRCGDYAEVGRWGQKLMTHYRRNGKEDDALATLIWLARLPLETEDRVEIELQLAQAMVESGRADEAYRRLQVYLTQWQLESLVCQQNYLANEGRFEDLLKGAEQLLSHETISELREKARALKGNSPG